MMFQFRLNHMAIEFYGIDWIEKNKQTGQWTLSFIKLLSQLKLLTYEMPRIKLMLDRDQHTIRQHHGFDSR